MSTYMPSLIRKPNIWRIFYIPKKSHKKSCNLASQHFNFLDSNYKTALYRDD